MTGSALHNDTGMVMSCTRGDRLRHGILSNMINHHAANKNSLELDEMILSYFASLTCDLFTALDSAHNHQTFSAKVWVYNTTGIHPEALSSLFQYLPTISLSAANMEGGSTHSHSIQSSWYVIH